MSAPRSDGRGARGRDAGGRRGTPRSTAGRRGSPGRPGDPARRSEQAEALGGEQVEGRQAVRELLVAGRRRVFELIVAEGRDPSTVLTEIVELARSRGVSVRFVPEHHVDSLARNEVHQGVVARAAPVLATDLARLLAPSEATAGGATGEVATPPFLVVLDGVTDPRNLGSVLRTASCAGATGAVLPRRRSAHLTPAALKAAAGAVEHLPIALVPGVGAALQELSRGGVWSIGLDADGERELDGLELLDGPVALVLGAEGRGLAALTRSRCDVLARIPLWGPLGSLNVAAAAAVACFAVAGRRRHPSA
ncbi:MAG TPA: 23S rRNA (guanosine(2251)-2'-O)-methyltransferase RlmB [Acidimicrobiales bacterium]|nr:23S rRNA (guanosine(2251)-2'-O)-methyltransferase RlmB [Acidimicrobiales bacterium]